MSKRFEKLIGFSLGWEVGKDKTGNLRADGGFTQDPADPGGATKWGISQKAYPKLDIPNLTLKEAVDIYKRDYWDVYKNNKFNPIDLDKDVDEAMAVVILDTGINCGVGRCSKWYQEAQKAKDPVKGLLGLRDAHYFNLVTLNKSMEKFYKGWIARLVDLRKFIDILRQDAVQK